HILEPGGSTSTRFVGVTMCRISFRALAVVGLVIGVSAPAMAQDDAFFDDNVLHTINLTVNSRDWDNLKVHYLENTYYPADLKWNDQVVRNVGIRSRGNSSRSGIKPALRVDFDRYTTDQKFLGLKSVVLRSNTQDASSMHERITMLLFRKLG